MFLTTIPKGWMSLYPSYVSQRRNVFLLPDALLTNEINLKSNIQLLPPCNESTVTGARGGPYNFKKCTGIRIRQK